MPVAGIMDIDEFEDYLELNDPKVRREIEKSNEDIGAGRTLPAREMLAELRGERKAELRRLSPKGMNHAATAACITTEPSLMVSKRPEA